MSGTRPLSVVSQTSINQRRGLLAKIHVAKHQMRLNDGEYEMILRSFKTDSAANLTIPQLENMVKLLKHYGWKEQIRIKQRKEGTGLNLSPNPEQIAALQDRANSLWGQISNLQTQGDRINSVPTDKRLTGLVKKICGVDDLTWCRDVAKLERLLAVLGKIKKEGTGLNLSPTQRRPDPGRTPR